MIEVMVLPFFATAGVGPDAISALSDPLLLLLSDTVAEAASATAEEAAVDGSSAPVAVSPVAVAAVDDLGDSSKAAGMATTADDNRASKFKSSYISIFENMKI
jgi:hypothetical protein